MTSRPRAAALVSFLLLAQLPVLARAEARAPRPHIVVIVADDLGWNDVGYHGSEIKTPRLDALAAEGVELDRFYVQPTCSPTRAALLTGRSPLRLGVVRPISKNEATGLGLSNRLLPEYLADAGYETRMAGKWHLGHVEQRFFPHRRGFESFYGHVTGGIGYWDHNHGGGHDWQRDGKTVRETGYSTHLIADEAVARIEGRDPSRPLFLYVAFNAPHLPNEAPDESIAAYENIENPHRRVHAAMVSELDRAIGRVLDSLDLAGMREDSIVWFTSDNGGKSPDASPAPLVQLAKGLEWLMGSPLPIEALEFLRTDTLEGGSDNRPLRGGKMTAYDGGVRVPAIVRWPGHFAPRKLENFVSVQDILPTLLGAARLPKPEEPLDGTSELELLRGGAPSPRPDYLTTALGDDAIYRGPWKLLQLGSTRELYNLLEDPGETNDLAAQHPEVVRELGDALAAFPRGEEIHGSILDVFLDPDRFGGPEDREPWADVAR